MNGTVAVEDFWLTFLVATALPMIVAVIKTRYASTKTGAIVLAVLSIVYSVLQEIYNAGQAGEDFEVKRLITVLFVTIVTAVSVHLGILQPTKITGNDGVILKTLPKGIGKYEAERDPDKSGI